MRYIHFGSHELFNSCFLKHIQTVTAVGTTEVACASIVSILDLATEFDIFSQNFYLKTRGFRSMAR